MSVLAQGTQIYMLVKATANAAKRSVVEIDDVTTFNPGGSPAEQVDTTTLKTRGEKTSKKGLRTPGSASATVLADSANRSHQILYELYEDDTNIQTKFVIGWPDGPVDEDGESTAPPTANEDGTDFVLPTSRTWFKFAGYVADFPFEHAANANITTALSIQRSGKGQWIYKTT